MTITVLNTKIDEVENEIPDTIGLVTNWFKVNWYTVLNIKIGEIKNKMLDVSNVVKKTNYNAKISGIEAKYFTTSGYNKFTKETLNAKIKEKGIVHKSNISNLVENSDSNTKLATSTKTVLNAEQDKIVKLQEFDSSHLRGKNQLEDDDTQNYVVFHPVLRYFIMIANTNKGTVWKSKGLSDENIKPPSISDNSLNPWISYIVNAKMWVKFDGICLKQEKVALTHKQVVNIYIVFVKYLSPFIVGKEFMLWHSLSGAVTLTTNPDPD